MAGTANPPIETQFRTIDGLRIRIAESEPRDVDALLLSPWPESLLAFEQMWAPLAKKAHLVAVDLPGYGHSESRPEVLEPRAMGEFIVKLADALDLERPHAVGPDIGTAALLFAAADSPDRFRSLVIGSGSVSVPLQVGAELKDFIEAPDLDFLQGADPRDGVAQVLAYMERYELPAATMEDYLSGYEGGRFVESLSFVRAYQTALPELSRLLGQIQTPVRIIQGDHDPGVLPANAEYAHERLPHSTLHFVDAGHFAYEDRAEQYIALILDWWNGEYERACS
jgi:pimeloyl-ACP methyl ester carboxylesterase